MSGLITHLLVFVIRMYKTLLSPLFPPSCRFYPTCSTFTIEALQKYGPLKGGWMGVRRIFRCHPWNPGGYDPVP